MNWTLESISNKLTSYIEGEFSEGEKITTETPLLSSGIIDSISILQLVEFLESTFDFEFEPHEVDQENLDTINIISAFVKSKI